MTKLSKCKDVNTVNSQATYFMSTGLIGESMPTLQYIQNISKGKQICKKKERRKEEGRDGRREGGKEVRE